MPAIDDDDPLQSEREEAQHARDVDLPPAAVADQRSATQRAQLAAEQRYVDTERDRAGQCDFADATARCALAKGHGADHDFSDQFAPPEPVHAEVVPEGEGPHPELAPLVDEQIGVSAELTVRDSQDRHEGLVAMDAHDVECLLKDLTEQAQAAALRKWVYELPQSGKPKGLSIHGVQDITQRMNWTGKCSIGVLPETLKVEVEKAETDDGVEVFIVATIFAEDGRTGAIMPGTSSEPRMMKLKKATAAAKRKDGKTIREDDKVFDRFARTKAIGKASRNALASFIPEEVEQAVIALADRNPQLVERIQTEAEAQIAEMPPPLDTPQAQALEKECKAIYAEIRELGGGQGRVAFPPGRYNSEMMQSRHSLEAMEAERDRLLERKSQLAAHYAKAEGGRG